MGLGDSCCGRSRKYQVRKVHSAGGTSMMLHHSRLTLGEPLSYRSLAPCSVKRAKRGASPLGFVEASRVCAALVPTERSSAMSYLILPGPWPPACGWTLRPSRQAEVVIFGHSTLSGCNLFRTLKTPGSCCISEEA